MEAGYIIVLINKKEHNMKIAVSSYSYNQYISTGEMSQLDAVKKAAEQGFDGIEFTELRPNNDRNASYDSQLAYAEDIRREVEKYGIEVSSYVVGANLYSGNAEADAKEVDRLCGQLRIAKALGAKIFRHDVCYSEKVDGRVIGYDRMLPTIAANARKVTEYAETLGIITCTENHGYIAQDSDRVEKLFNTVAHDNYGLLVDMGNFACADEDSARAVSRLAPYAVHVHAKDFHKIPFSAPEVEGEKSFRTRGFNRLVGCAVGDGDIPVAQCLAILKKAGYDGYIVIEFEGSGECFGEIEKGRSFLLENLK